MSKRSFEQVEGSNIKEKVAKLTQEKSSIDTTHNLIKTHSLLLARLNGAELPSQLHSLDQEYNTLYKLLKQTVTSGESNSCLLIGNRGTGKTALVRTVLRDLEKLKNEFCIVKLSGLTETNDRLALNEIARQLVTEQDQDDRSFVSTINQKANRVLIKKKNRLRLQTLLIICCHY